MKLTVEQVRHVATLARLSLTAEEEQKYLGQLGAILEAVDKLGELDTSKVEPTSHATMSGVHWREDVQLPSLPPEQGLKNAPARSGTSFSVPKILE